MEKKINEEDYKGYLFCAIIICMGCVVSLFSNSFNTSFEMYLYGILFIIIFLQSASINKLRFKLQKKEE